MKLWHISQSKNNGYDTYDSAVVAAETEEQARVTSPNDVLVWNAARDSWVRAHDGTVPYGLHGNGTWTTPQHVKVEYLGEAKEGTAPGVICSSFNAG